MKGNQGGNYGQGPGGGDESRERECLRACSLWLAHFVYLDKSRPTTM